MRFFILFFLGFSLMGQDIFEHAKRGENYRVWVYFDERDLKSTIDLSLDAEIRRKKHNVETPTKFDYNIKQEWIANMYTFRYQCSCICK